MEKTGLEILILTQFDKCQHQYKKLNSVNRDNSVLADLCYLYSRNYQTVSLSAKNVQKYLSQFLRN